MIYGKNIGLPFGKYKGETSIEILEKDPKYLIWCIENIKNFDLPVDVYQKAKEATLNNATEKRVFNLWNDMDWGDEIPY